MTLKASFIIPSYNSLKTLPRTLESCLNQSVRDFEIIVVDSSEDEMAIKHLQVVASNRLKVIFLDFKTMPAHARNIGAEQAKADLLCFIDSDVELAPDWLEVVLAAYQNGCHAGGGKIAIPDSQRDHKIARAQLYLQFNEYLSGTLRQKRHFVPSCNMFCGRTVFNAVGGFPVVRASEDTLFFLQLKGRENVYYLPKAKCYHFFREDEDAFLKNQYLLGHYVSVYRKQYYQSWMYRGLIPLILSPLFLLIKFARMVKRIFAAGEGHGRFFLGCFWDFVHGFAWWSAGFIKGFIKQS